MWSYTPIVDLEKKKLLTCIFCILPPTVGETHKSLKHSESMQNGLESNLQPSCCDAAVHNPQSPSVAPSIQALLTSFGVDVGPQDVPAGEVR